MVDKDRTPLPATPFAPVQVELADYFDLAANSDVERLDQRRFGNQAIDVRKVGARPESNVTVSVETTRQTNDGRITESDTFDTTGLNSFGTVTDSGPFANERLVWSFSNRSNTDYTQANNNVYQAHLNYVIRRMTVVEKLRRDVPLTDDEEELARRFGLLQRESMGLPQDLPTYLQPNLEDKVIRERESEVQTVTISTTGIADAVPIASESKLRQRGVVAYVTGIQLNSQNFTRSDNLKVRFTRSGTDGFYDIETFGMPGYADEYKADLFLPFTDQMNVSVWADNSNNNTPSNVDVNLEYSIVERTIVEQALYDLSNEVQNVGLLRDIQRQISAGVPINVDVNGGGS